jgi:hypothetical protein
LNTARPQFVPDLPPICLESGEGLGRRSASKKDAKRVKKQEFRDIPSKNATQRRV